MGPRWRWDSRIINFVTLNPKIMKDKILKIPMALVNFVRKIGRYIKYLLFPEITGSKETTTFLGQLFPKGLHIAAAIVALGVVLGIFIMVSYALDIVFDSDAVTAVIVSLLFLLTISTVYILVKERELKSWNDM